MPSLVVYLTSKTYDYLYSQAKKDELTINKKASLILELAAEEELITVDLTKE